MTDGHDQDPHADYRRQAAQRFGAQSAQNPWQSPVPTPPSDAPEPPAAPVEPPRIFRGDVATDTAPPTEPAPPTDTTPPTEPAPSRFAAGTTYTGRAESPAPPPPAPTLTAPPAAAAPTPPMPDLSAVYGTPPQHTGDRPAPAPAVAPTAASAAPPPPPPPPWQPSPGQAWPDAPGAAPRAGLNLQPSQVLWALAGLTLLASLVLGFGWVLVAAGCGAAAYYTQARRTPWHPDMAAVLARFGLAAPTGPAPYQGPPQAVIPFRPLTFPEIFTGAFRVVARNWPTLVGIPIAILAALFIVFGVVSAIVMSIAVSATSASSFLDSADPATVLTTMFAGFMGVMLLLTLLFVVLAVPADALLLGLSVSATDTAVRGGRVQMAEAFRAARARLWPVCRLTLCYYGLFFVVYVIGSVVLSALLIVAWPLAMLLTVGIFAGCFLAGVMFSLAPIVLVVENRGVIDSLKRASQLAKSAFGRLLGIHALWAVCVAPLLFVPGMVVGLALGEVGTLVFVVLAFAVLAAYFRALQMLIYTDLRMRQERFEAELIADWARNTGS